MEEAGIPRQGGPIGVMLYEHTQGRDYVRGLADAVAAYRAGDTGAVPRIVENARGYLQLLSQHIYKEDSILYPMADRFLSPQKQAELLKCFAQVEREQMGPGKHKGYHVLLEELEKAYLA